jgi:lipoprotein NlpD
MPPRHALRRSAAARLLASLALVAAVAGCASGPPAPVVSRTMPGAAGPARPGEPAVVAPPGAPSPAAPDAAAPAPEGPSVQTAPVRSGTVESRGIESRPLDGRPVAPGTALPSTAAPTAPALPPNTRTGPRGVKVPYSDGALAELKAAESGAAPAGSAGAPAAAAGAGGPGARPADPKAADPKAIEPDRAADGGDDWAWPSSGRVLQTFDQSASKGISLGGRVGDPVLAAADGRVIFSGNGPRGYGNLVIVKHSNELLSVYAHNRTLAVKEGQPVKRGQKIAELGDSGTTSAKLHFEIRQQGKPVDPMKFLPRR